MSKDEITISNEITTVIVSKEPTAYFRWLVKKDGTRVLQQMYRVVNDYHYESKWEDVSEVYE